MGRSRGRPRNDGTTPGDSRVKDLLAKLAETGGETQVWRFRERTESGLQYIGDAIPVSELPADEVAGHVKNLREIHGVEGDIVVYLHNVGDKEALRTVEGTPAKVLFAAPVKRFRSAPSPHTTGLPGPLAERARDLQEKEAELSLDRKEAKLEEEKKRIVAMKNGTSEGNGTDPRWPFGPGIPYEIVEVGPGEFMPVRTDGRSRRRREEEDDDQPFRRGRGRDVHLEIQLETMRQQGAERLEMIRMMNQPRENPLASMIALMPLIQGNQLKPADMIALVSPMMAESAKASASSSRATVELVQMFAEKLIDQAMEDGKPDDEVDKIRRWADLGKDVLGGAIKATLGRESILDPNKARVPLPPAAETKMLPASSGKPGLVARNAPGKVSPPRVLPRPVVTAPAPAPPEATTEQIAKAVGVERVQRIMAIHEREMFILSDPAAGFEDPEDERELIKLLTSLPGSLRKAILAQEVGAIYEAAREFVPAEVDRILTLCGDPALGTERQAWATEFWEEMGAALAPEKEPEGPAKEPDAAEPEGKREPA